MGMRRMLMQKQAMIEWGYNELEDDACDEGRRKMSVRSRKGRVNFSGWERVKRARLEGCDLFAGDKGIAMAQRATGMKCDVFEKKDNALDDVLSPSGQRRPGHGAGCGVRMCSGRRSGEAMNP
eukprot:9488530-Pyramimonas_sp.AAC.2